MYGQCLITPTLLDAYEFAINAPKSWQSQANAGFLAKLRREKVVYPEWVGKGLAFEDTVYRVCSNHKSEKPIKKGSELFQKIANKCYGGTFQGKLSKKIQVDDKKVFLFGYTDVQFPELTIDLKTTLNYTGPTKYLNGHQHLVYSYIRETPLFEYVIAQWESKEANKLQAVHVVEYNVSSFEDLENEIVAKIKSMFTYLEKENLWLDYYNTFSKN